MRRIYFVLVMAAFVASRAFSQMEATLVTSVSAASQGVYYHLPKTTVYVDVEVHKSTVIPGEYAIYAEQFLKLNDVATQQTERYGLKNVTAHLISEPDPSALYLLTVPKNKSLPMLQFTANGLLQSVNIPADLYEPVVLPIVPAKQLIEGISTNPKELMGEEFLASGSTLKMAEIVAKKIVSIRETRSDVLAGEADNMPKDGAAMKFVVETLNEQERALLTLFEGYTQVEVIHYRFPLTPKSVADKQIAFRFSELFGVVGVNDLSGYPVMASFSAAPPKPVILLTVKEEKKNDKKGLVYINPSQVDFVLSTPTQDLYKNRYNMTQFGQIGVLPSSLFSSSKLVQIKFDPSLGRIVELKREH